MRQVIFAFLLASLVSSVYAGNSFFCKPVKIIAQNKTIILPGPGASESSNVYFFKNLSDQGVWIDHPSGRKSMNAGWSSYLRSGNWSAFLSNRKDFVISCARIKPGSVENLDCAKAISVCAPASVSFKTAPKGTYWLAEDKSWDEIVKIAQKRGAIMK